MTQPVEDIHSGDLVAGEIVEIQKSAGLQAKPGKRAACPIVGVGASAGGLEAFTEFLSTARIGDGLSYVLVQHLDPTHDSLLGQLLAKKTDLPVVTVEDGMIAVADTIHLIPPNYEMKIRDGVLHLERFHEPRGVRRPIDEFFQSLAEDQRENSACVVLSGTGSDGTHGLRAVKTAGGLTMVQDPTESKFAGMPSSALNTGLVDASMEADQLVPHIRQFFDSGQRIAISEKAEEPGEFLDQALNIVRMRTGHDFSRYKNATLVRRLRRRMQIVGTESEEDYLTELVGPGGESSELFRDLLINVTSFFRDPEEFDVLRRQVIQKLLEDKGAGDKIRVWCPGSSSGEEPYTVAMLFREELDRMSAQPSVQIFGTDIDPMMIEIARNGVYPQSISNDVPPELFDRYFTPTGDGYRIDSRIRDMVRISDHNVIKDPPFSRLDLIVCRNLLIYFGSELQERVIPMFHYALRKGGFFFIGPSENLTAHADLFEPVNDSSKIFTKRNVTPRYSLFLDRQGAVDDVEHQIDDELLVETVDEKRINATIAQRYTAPHIVVNEQQRVVFASPRSGRYVEFVADSKSMPVSEIVKEGLRAPIGALLTEISDTTFGRKRARNIRLEFDDDAPLVNLSAEDLGNGQVLIVFSEFDTPQTVGPDDESRDGDIQDLTQERRLHVLEQELGTTRANLRTTVEQLETSNEELKSSNEEMMSMNEELQSANEELSTMNDELQDKLKELASANADIENYLGATRMPVLFINSDLTIRSFTPETTKLFKLATSDIGRRLTDIRSEIEGKGLVEAMNRVCQTGDVEEYAVQTADGFSHYLVRILPYRTASYDQQGIVATFTDVSEIASVSAQLAKAQDELQRQFDEIVQLYRAAPLAMGLYDREFRYLRLNEELAEIHNIDVEAHIGQSIRDVIPGVADHAEKHMQTVFDTGKIVETEEVILQRPHLGPEPRVYKPYYYPVPGEDGIQAVGAIIRDVTEEREMENELRRVMRELQHRVKNMLANVLTLVRQADRSDASKSEALKTLAQRLRSLALTHDALTQTDWRTVDLHELVKAELLKVYGEERVTVKGPEVSLSPRATLSLGMALHEMATNASKYGALSVEDGVLDLRWRIADEGEGSVFSLQWMEKSSRKDSTDFTKSGFGSSLIESSISGTLDGTVEKTFGKDGLECTIQIPLENLTDDPASDDQKD